MTRTRATTWRRVLDLVTAVVLFGLGVLWFVRFVIGGFDDFVAITLSFLCDAVVGLLLWQDGRR